MTEKRITRNHVTFSVIKRYLFFIFVFILIIKPFKIFSEDTDRVWVGEFSKSVLEGWKPKRFENTTHYELIDIDQGVALQAVSRGGASGLVRKIRVDLDKTPYLNWRWRIENRLTGIYDETTKQGDDYAARVYIVVSGGLAFWRTTALNYVWGRHVPKGKVWQSAWARDNSVMAAIRSFEDPVAVWQMEKRDVKKDFKTCFGKEIRYIDAVALMTDTDDTKNQATAVYGDIYFSSQ